jgi:hypothetical protein
MNILAVLAHERDGFEYVRDPRLPRNIARLIDVGRLIGFSTDTSLLKIDYWRKDADLDREKIELDDSAAFKGRVKDVICWPAGNPRYRH